MRILDIGPATEKRLLAARAACDERALGVARRIITDVKRRGDSALFAWSKRLDGFRAAPGTLWVSRDELRNAARRVGPGFLAVIRQAARNIRLVAGRQLPQSWSIEVEAGVRIRQLVRPIESVGCYVPGGRSSLVSTLLMTAVPAKVAGVPQIITVCPKPNDE